LGDLDVDGRIIVEIVRCEVVGGSGCALCERGDERVFFIKQTIH
jgi:hypothetical protein